MEIINSFCYSNVLHHPLKNSASVTYECWKCIAHIYVLDVFVISFICYEGPVSINFNWSKWFMGVINSKVCTLLKGICCVICIILFFFRVTDMPEIWILWDVINSMTWKLLFEFSCNKLVYMTGWNWWES